MIGPLERLLFVLLTTAAVAASVHAWRARHAYGYFRFFGFEFLALLVVWNARRWFRQPLSLEQVISWIIIVSATVLAIHGIYLLRSVGRAERRIMEDTQAVVEVGVYRYIRHPLYGSLLFLGWGVFFKGIDLVSCALAISATLCWVVTARYEERFNVAHFGVPYIEYMARTKMFIPFIF